MRTKIKDIFIATFWPDRGACSWNQYWWQKGSFNNALKLVEFVSTFSLIFSELPQCCHLLTWIITNTLLSYVKIFIIHSKHIDCLIFTDTIHDSCFRFTIKVGFLTHCGSSHFSDYWSQDEASCAGQITAVSISGILGDVTCRQQRSTPRQHLIQ